MANPCNSKDNCFLVEKMKVEFDGDESIVLYCIYRLQSATSAEIMEYAEKLMKNGQYVDIQIGNIDNALNNLENIGTVKLERGKYILNETILIIK